MNKETNVKVLGKFDFTPTTDAHPLPRAKLSILYQQGDPEGKRKQSGGSGTRIITLLWTGKQFS